MRPVTKRQQEVLTFISTYIREKKFPPTIREISDNFSISVKGAYDHVKALEKKKTIRCNTNKSRAIEILESDVTETEEEKLRSIPLLGSVAAGKPLMVEENYDGFVQVPEYLLRKKNYFALHVQGDSMVDAGIMDGDVVVVSHESVAENGDIVVAMVDEAVTLKRFYRESNRIKLKSENSAYPPIYTRDVRVLGKLAHLIRSYE